MKQPKRLPKVSLIVPAYNEEGTILKTITSLLAADYPASKKEIIVVNDGSKDRTAQVVRSFIKKHPSVHLVDKKNGGKASAVNAGLRVAKGELVGVVDADSRISENSIRTMLPHFADPEIGAVISRIRVDEPRNFLEKLQRFEYIMSSMTRKIMSNFGTLAITPGVLSLYRADVIRELGGFTTDEKNLTEDLEIAMRLKAHNYQIHMEPDAITFTNVPKTVHAVWRQRIRWTRGYVYNHVKYRHMFFSKKHGLFGTFMLPVNVLAILLLVTNMLLIGYELIDHWIEFTVRSLTIPNYFWNSITDMPTLKQFILAKNAHIIIPLMIALALGIYLVVYAHRYFRENLKNNIGSAFAYTIVVPYFSTLNWVASIAQEISGRKRKW